MKERLTAYVHVVNDDGDNVVLKPGDTVPGWAKDQVTNPKAFAGSSEADEPADNSDGDTPPPPSAPPTATDYESVTAKDLKAEIAKRNEGRGDDSQVVPEAPGNKPELIAALQADDAASGA